MTDIDDWLLAHDQPHHVPLPAFDPWTVAAVHRDAPGSGSNFRREFLVYETHHCQVCGAEYRTPRAWSRYCSRKCAWARPRKLKILGT